MALKPNARLTFVRYEVERDGVTLWFLCHDPGAGQPSDYPVFVSNTELAAITTQLQLRDLCLAKLKRWYRADGIASKLDALIGQSITLP